MHNVFHNNYIILRIQAQFISQCIFGIKKELKSGIANKANAISKLTYVRKYIYMYNYMLIIVHSVSHRNFIMHSVHPHY